MRRLSALVVVLLSAPVAAGAARASEPVPAGAVAVVAGEPVPIVGYTDQIARVRSSYALRKKAFPAPGTPEFRAIRDTAVALLVFRVEVRQQAGAEGIVVSDAEVAARVGQIEQQWGSNPREFQRMLRRLGLTRRALLEDVRARLTLDAVRERLRAEQTVSDAEVADHYRSNIAEFTDPSTRRIRQIVVRTRVRALKVLRRLRAGASFAAVARRYSVDRSTRRAGGIAIVAAGDGPFQRFAFSVRTGALVGPVRFSDGWHVLEALGPIRPGRVKPLVEVASEIRENLLSAKTGNAVAQWLDDLRRAYVDKVVYADGFAPGKD